MKKKFKGLRKTVVALAFAFIIGTSSVPTLPVNATSAEVTSENTTEVTTQSAKPYMKTLKKVKFDLKKNKKVTYPNLWINVGFKEATAKVTNFKIKDAKKDGYKQATFRINYTMDYKPKNKEEVNKLGRAFSNYGKFYCGDNFAVVDYDTGKCLESKNDYGVTVKYGNYKGSDRKTYYGTHGAYISFDKNFSIKVTITYPKDYKGLCLGVGGCLKKKETSVDKAFWKGKTPFGKTSYYSNKKTNFHFMRITK